MKYPNHDALALKESEFQRQLRKVSATMNQQQDRAQPKPTPTVINRKLRAVPC